MKASSMSLVTRFTNVPSLVLNTWLEHCFETSKVDAAEALRLYRRFCKQAEKVVEFLGVAKKLQNLPNVPISNLKHVRSSLPAMKLLSDRHPSPSSALWKNTWTTRTLSKTESSTRRTMKPQRKLRGMARGVTKKLDEPSESFCLFRSRGLSVDCSSKRFRSQ